MIGDPNTVRYPESPVKGAFISRSNGRFKPAG
jgi:hypothetical protein